MGRQPRTSWRWPGSLERPTSRSWPRRPPDTRGIRTRFCSAARQRAGITVGAFDVIAGLVDWPGRRGRFRTRGLRLLVFAGRLPDARSSRRGTQSACVAVVGLSGGLIGPPGTPARLSWLAGGRAGVPGLQRRRRRTFPLARVRETADVFRRMGASVDERIYPRMGHTVRPGRNPAR